MGSALAFADTSSTGRSYQSVIDQICALNWRGLTKAGLIDVAWAYYYFSVQFRENLEIARRLHPDDAQLLELDQGERDTANLSPYPGVAAVGERMNHDEFMRRALLLSPVDADRQRHLEAAGGAYLAKVRGARDECKAMSIASYEDGGLEAVFTAILTAPHWNDPALEAFHHFLTQHIAFDSDPDHGHGALARHLGPTGEIVPLWIAFRDVLTTSAPGLVSN